MKWLRAKLKDVAPSRASTIRFAPSDEVWHLNLDQIESDTGSIVNKKVAPISESGSSTYVFDQTNVLYSKLRPYLNKVVCPDEPGIATSELVPLKPNPSVLDRRYLTYYLRSKEFLNFANVAVAGVKMPRMIMPKFWRYQIPLPPLSEQRRIVEILDQANALRKKRAEADKKAERILTALFYKMFGDPLRNPKKWEMVPLSAFSGDDGLITDGDWILSENMDDNGSIRLIQLADIGQGRFLDRSNKFITPEKFRELNCTEIFENDILVSRMADPIGRACLLPKLLHRAITAVDITIIRPDCKVAKPHFIVCLCNTNYFLGQAASAASGTTRGRITRKNLEKIQVPKPPLPIQERFTEMALQIMEKDKQRNTSAEKIELLFSSILHRAFSGDLTAKWREAHMKELLSEMELQAKALNLEVPA